MLQTSGTTTVLGGHQPHLVEFDLITAKEIKKVSSKKKFSIVTNLKIIIVLRLKLVQQVVPFFDNIHVSSAQVMQLAVLP
jgi:hypothetical protein